MPGILAPRLSGREKLYLSALYIELHAVMKRDQALANTSRPLISRTTASFKLTKVATAA